VHAFIVPLRDENTHKLLPGVLVGDCGPKNGCNEIDNGFILLDKVRISVNNLLDRISQIDDNGKFKSILDSEDKRFGLQLGSLSGGRYMIAMNGSIIAMQALTIALRYSAVRRQFAKSAK
jgi:acyl-CoA oxidase